MPLAHRSVILAAALALAAAAAPAAQGKTVTEACRKDLSTGIVSFDSSRYSEDYILRVITFRQTSRDARYAYGVCTISVKYQPPD
jgi:hypothetical protein